MSMAPDAGESSTSDLGAEPRPHTRPSHARLRKLYFLLAAGWGFLAGAGVTGFAVRQEPVPRVLALVVGLAVGLSGGLVCAAAYREARRHH